MTLSGRRSVSWVGLSWFPIRAEKITSVTLLGHLFIFMCIYIYEYTSEIVIEERDFFANSKYVAVTQKCDFCSFANNRKNILARIQSKSIGISFFCTSLQKKAENTRCQMMEIALLSYRQQSGRFFLAFGFGSSIESSFFLLPPFITLQIFQTGIIVRICRSFWPSYLPIPKNDNLT